MYVTLAAFTKCMMMPQYSVILNRFAEFFDSVNTTAGKICTASTKQNKTFCHCFGNVKNDVLLKIIHFFWTTKHNSGLLLAIWPDLSTLVFQTNQDNYEEQVLGWNSLKNKPFLSERIWHVLAMSLVLGFTLRAGRGVSWTSWALTCANSCTGELEVPSSFI